MNGHYPDAARIYAIGSPAPESPAVRRLSLGKPRREAMRCLKRHVAPRVWHLLQPEATTTIPPSTHTRPCRRITIHCNTPIANFH